jgi:hypothetical protein
MVETITPVVHGGRRSRWAVAVVLHALGAVASAGTLGAVLGAAGMLLGAPWGPAGPLLLAAVATLYGAAELLGIRVPVPAARRQVPEWWRWTLPPPWAALIYGLGLGIGFLTHLRHGTLVAVALAAATSGDPLVSAVVFGSFGLARAVPLVAMVGATADKGVAAVARRLESVGSSAAPRLANGLVLVALAVSAAAAMPDVPGESAGLAVATLIVVFAWATVAKAVRPAVWRRALSGYRLGLFTRPAAVAVPLAEATVVALLIGGYVPMAGVIAAALVTSFTVAILATHEGDRADCGCFGGHRTVDYRLLVARNIGLAVLAAVVVADPVSPFPPLPAIRMDSVLPFSLVAAGVAFTLVLGRRLAALGTR